MPTGTGSPSWECQVGLIGAPESYARAGYHAVHTFWVTAPTRFAGPFAFPGSRSQAFATPIPRPSGMTNICSMSLETACSGGRPDSC